MVIGPGANIFFVRPTAALNTSGHSCALIAQLHERAAIAGVDWPLGVLGFFNNGPMDGCFIYLFVYLLILLHLALVTTV